MSLPQIAGHELQDFIGGGACGAVYRATAAGGQSRAVKVFSSMAVNRRSLAATMRALQHMRPHRGILPVHGYSFDQSPYYAASPLVGVMAKDGQGRPRWQTPTLESLCGKVAPDQAWVLIYEIADALGWLHKHGIAHGNLRAANVLIEDDPQSSSRLTDIGQGWSGGVHHFELGDHWMHLCPDHIEDPDNAQSGEGLSWDVYSFGVIAYRLLTGKFPRAQQAWQEQTAIARQKAASGLPHQIDGGVLLSAIRSEPVISWPSKAMTQWDDRCREIISKALALDAASRWNDMREVIREFEMLETDFLLDEAVAKIEVEKKRQSRRVRVLQIICGALMASLTVATTLFALTYLRARKSERIISENAAAHAGQLAARDTGISTLTQQRDDALSAMQRSDANLRHAQGAVDQFLTQLLETPSGNAMEVEFSRNQLTEAITFVKDSLPSLDAPQLAPERARAYGNLGRLHLRLHETKDAVGFLEKARVETATLITNSTDAAQAALYHQWRGRNELLLSDIRASEGRDDEALALLKEATADLETGLAADTKNRLARYECARAWLEYGERAYATGDLTEAAAALSKVPAVLDEKLIGEELLNEEKFIVARSKFQRGLVMRDSGKVQESLDTIIEAVREMDLLVAGSSPQNQDQALKLAEACTEFAEIVGKHASAESAKESHDRAISTLLELNRLLPEWAEVKYLLARNYGAIASLERDKGNNAEALKKKNDAMEMLNEVLADNKDNARYTVTLAKLLGEYAEMISDQGKARDAVPLVKRAVASMENLLGPDAAISVKLTPQRKSWEIQFAQLYGILGHASEAAGQKDTAKTSFQTAVARWEKLSAADPADETIQQGLSWSKNRLAKLK